MSGSAPAATVEGAHCRSMTSMTQRLLQFLRSPRGRRLAQQAQDFAARPENQRRLQQLLRRRPGRR
jgi:hypothetical protein